MRKRIFVKALSLILTFATLITLFVPLSINAIGTDALDSSEKTLNKETKVDLSGYCIIVSSDASDYLLETAASLSRYIEMYCGLVLVIKTDASEETAKEILVGTTKRNAGISVSDDAWLVKRNGEKIVLSAGKNADIANATNYFIANCLQRGSKYAYFKESDVRFKIGNTEFEEIKIALLSSDNVGYIDAAVILADNIRMVCGIAPSIVTYDDNATGQILVASTANGAQYSSVSVGEKQYAITRRKENIIIVANEIMGADIGTQTITKALGNLNENVLDLNALCSSEAQSYTFGTDTLLIESGAEYRIMSYNIERIELGGVGRDGHILDNILFYSPDVLGFQEYCVDMGAILTPKLKANGYDMVAPKPTYHNANDTSCDSKYSMDNDYTAIAYKADKLEVIASGAQRVIPCRKNSSSYENTAQPTYGWPGYTLTWAVFKDRTTGKVFAVTSLHNLTGSDTNNVASKIISLGMVKEIVDDITSEHSCPIFMVGDYNSKETMGDYKSFVNEENGIYDARYVAERGYSTCSSHHTRGGAVARSGKASDSIDHILVKGNARVIRQRSSMSEQTFAASDHKPIFVDVVIGETSQKIDKTEIFSGLGSSFHINRGTEDTNIISNAEFGYNLSHNTYAPNGPIAISEVATGVSDKAKGYDFVEIMNVSNEPIDLSDYYIHRDTRSHAGTFAATVAQAILFHNGLQPTASLKSRLATEKTLLGAGDMALLWFNSSTDKTVEGFRSSWNISSDVTVVEIKIAAENTIDELYGTDQGDNKTQSGAKGDYLSRNNKVSYSLTVVHREYSDALANYTVFKSKNANNFNAVEQRILKHLASCVVAVSCDMIDGGSMTKNTSVEFSNFYDKTLRQKALDSMTTAPTKAIGINSFYYGLEMNFENATPFMSVTQTNDTTVAAFPTFAFGNTVTPGTVGADHLGFQFNAYANGAKGGSAVITEIVTSALKDGFEYEFVEIYNSSAEPVDLSKYSLLQFGFTNTGGRYEASGYRQIMGDSATAKGQYAYADLSRAVYSAPGKSLDKGETAVLCFYNSSSSVSASEFVGKFKTYWNLGEDANVVCVPYFNARKNEGNGFMPDYRYSYSIAFLDVSKTAVSSAYNEVKANSSELSKDNRNILITNADCTAFVATRGRKVNNVAANYYKFSSNNSNLVMGEKVNVKNYYNRTSNYDWSESWLNGKTSYDLSSPVIRVCETVFGSAPTPDALCEGQFGYESEPAKIEALGVQCTEAVNGKVDIRIIGYIDSLDYNAISIELMAAIEATDTTLDTATNNTSNAVYKPKLTVDTYTVYTSINGKDKSGQEKIYDLEYFKKDSGYIFAIRVQNVLVDKVNLTVRCTATKGDTDISTGIYEISRFGN